VHQLGNLNYNGGLCENICYATHDGVRSQQAVISECGTRFSSESKIVMGTHSSITGVGIYTDT